MKMRSIVVTGIVVLTVVDTSHGQIRLNVQAWLLREVGVTCE